MRKALEIDVQMLKAIYRTASSENKALLEEKFGKDLFIQNIMDIVTSYESACTFLGKDPVAELPYPNPETNRQRFANAAIKLDIINETLLDGTKLNWEDSNQRKWGPWFNNYKSGSGFRFLVSGFDWSATGALGGARLCLDTKEKSDYFGTQFLDIWNDFLNPIK